MDASRSRCVRVMVVLTDAPFREKPPRLSRMDALGARSEMNTPLRDNWGGFSRKGVLCRLRYQPFKKYTMFFFLYLPSLLNFRLFYLKVTRTKQPSFSTFQTWNKSIKNDLSRKTRYHPTRQHTGPCCIKLFMSWYQDINHQIRALLHKTFYVVISRHTWRHKSSNHDINRNHGINPLHKTLWHKSRLKIMT